MFDDLVEFSLERVDFTLVVGVVARCGRLLIVGGVFVLAG